MRTIHEKIITGGFERALTFSFRSIYLSCNLQHNPIKWSERLDSNQRPLASKASRLHTDLLSENIFAGLLGIEPRLPHYPQGALPTILEAILKHLVRHAGFEPATPCSQSRCASQAALMPDEKII